MTDHDHDLTISRHLAAPPSRVWTAWSRPEHLAQWWIPAPMQCRVETLDLRPGGGFETLMREDDGKPFQPHLEACFLEIEPERRLVFTTTLAAGWRPIEPWLALTAIITLDPEDEGTRYSARVMHKSVADAAKHDKLGFEEGWGTAIAQLDRHAGAMDPETD